LINEDATKLLEAMRKANAIVDDYLYAPFPDSQEEIEVEITEVMEELHEILNPIVEEYDNIGTV